jgi:hypothetical protein
MQMVPAIPINSEAKMKHASLSVGCSDAAANLASKYYAKRMQNGMTGVDVSH